MSALVVLRGNSGSGKSTVARLLRSELAAVWIEQDYFRRVVLGETGNYTPLSVDLIENAATVSLAAGRTVILDGIFNAAKYSEAFNRLSAGHQGLNLFYAYDLSFDETVRRHRTRPHKASSFGPHQMRGWYHGWNPLDGIDETRITAEATADDVAAHILARLQHL